MMIFLVLYTTSLVVIIGLAWRLEWKILLLIFFSCYSIGILFKSVLFKRPSSFTGLCKRSNDWFVYSAAKDWQLIKLAANNCVVLSWIIILQFKIEENNQVGTLCLLIDSLQVDDFRRLKVNLRLGR